MRRPSSLLPVGTIPRPCVSTAVNARCVTCGQLCIRYGLSRLMLRASLETPDLQLGAMTLKNDHLLIPSIDTIIRNNLLSSRFEQCFVSFSFRQVKQSTFMCLQHLFAPHHEAFIKHYHSTSYFTTLSPLCLSRAPAVDVAHHRSEHCLHPCRLLVLVTSLSRAGLWLWSGFGRREGVHVVI